MPPRRPRQSISSATGADDVSHLTLAEVRDRLKRNTALLSSPLFASPPATPYTTAIGGGVGVPGPGPNTLASSDPVRDKLVLARDALLAREQELMLATMKIDDSHPHPQSQSQPQSPVQPHARYDAQSGQNGLNGGIMDADADTGAGARRASADAHGSGTRSGKARVLESIKAAESRLARNGLILPIDQTLTLGDRDYQNATTAALAHLSLNHTRSSSPKPRTPRDRFPSTPSSRLAEGGEDEIARANRLARVNAFMSYKGSLSDDEDDDDDDGFYDDHDDDDDEGDGEGEGFPPSALSGGGYDGNGLPTRPVDAIGEEVDEYGEDDEVFAEGNEDRIDVDDTPRAGLAPGV